MTRALQVAFPVLVAATAFLAGRAASPGALPPVTATVAAPSPVARHPSRPVPCPPDPAAPPPAPDPLVPVGWDGAGAEAQMWEQDAPALEAAGAHVVLVDCGRYPCLAVVAFDPATARDTHGDVLRARWPDASSRSTSSLVDGQAVWSYVVVTTDADGKPDLEREVDLRAITVKMDARDAVDEFHDAALRAP